MSWLEDKRTTSLSTIVEMTIGDYLELAEVAYHSRGGLAGQREPLKTTSAVQIRQRMLKDLSVGAVLPPLVVGVVVEEETYQSLKNERPHFDAATLSEKSKQSIAIIDGMQRTTALHEAVEQNPTIAQFPIRVEWWISKKIQSLVYRMMVLNTAQVPWTMARQMSVLYGAMVQGIIDNVGDAANIMTDENPGRRTRTGEYASETVVDLYLSFSKRKTKVDTKQEVSEKFARLDLLESVSDEQFQDAYYEVLKAMTKLDHQFGRANDASLGRFSKGKSVFGTHPARIGFIVAAGQLILGRAGADHDTERQKQQLEAFEKGIKAVLDKLEAMNEEEINAYMQLGTLEEILEQRSGKVGEYERAVFFEAFKVLFEDYDSLADLTAVWRAY
ncbi:MAG: hypothetical protein ACPG5W_06530 [Flavobacteriales bacterium]